MWNDKETNIDLLGHKRIAQTIINIISDNNLRPLTIGIYGDWGVGKSSILALLQEIIKAKNKENKKNSHCIMFNGWLFQGYEDTKTSLMETVISELARLQPANKKIQKLAKSLLGRVNWLKLAKLTAGVAITGLTGIPAGGILSEAYTRTKKMLETSEDDSLIKEKEEDEKEETVTNQIHAFRKEFKELVESSKVDHVIVLVDDLDRCLPRSVIEILEAIRLFLFVEGTTFVLAADEKMVEYAVREHFPNLPASYSEYTKNYLEKLIQIPIRIPTLTKLQTGNYIRLLMLQYHLHNDQQRLSKVYEAYERKKKRPYDPIELSYELIIEAIGNVTAELNDTLFVAGQLTPTLSTSLRGNPRNIKRFLNTLFLRLRIAVVYGLDDIVQMNVLAKIMLLERFQPEEYDKIVTEVTSDRNGQSKYVKDLEATKENGNITQNLKDWLALDPPLTATDLRPYIFICKEKAVSFDTDGIFPQRLTGILEQLNSNSDIALNKAQKDLSSLPLADITLLFEALVNESRRISDVKNIPVPVKGLLRIINVQESFELKLIELIATFPTGELGPWAISELSGLKSAEGKARFEILREQWAKQASNKILATLANQKLK